MNQVHIKPVSYFTYEVLAWDSWPERININGSNIEELLTRIEDGGNLFEVIPDFKQDKLSKFKLEYAKFEQRNETEINGENFVSEKGYKQVGKLLVPHYEIAKLEDGLFYNSKPLNSAEILILNQHQLI